MDKGLFFLFFLFFFVREMTCTISPPQPDPVLVFSTQESLVFLAAAAYREMVRLFLSTARTSVCFGGTVLALVSGGSAKSALSSLACILPKVGFSTTACSPHQGGRLPFLFFPRPFFTC